MFEQYGEEYDYLFATEDSQYGTLDNIQKAPEQLSPPGARLDLCNSLEQFETYQEILLNEITIYLQTLQEQIKRSTSSFDHKGQNMKFYGDFDPNKQNQLDNYQFKIYCQQIWMLGHQQASTSKVRIMAVILFLTEIGIMFAYGFGSSLDMTYSKTANSDSSAYLISYILAAILAILGWGLIIAYSENSAVSGLAITLMATGLTVQLQPLTGAFWNYCFMGFNGQYPMSLGSQLLTMYSLTSLLVALCFVSGRIGIFETFIVIMVFNFGWPMCFNFMLYLFKYKWSGQIEIFDCNGVNYVYVFGAVFGLVVSLVLNAKEGIRPTQSGSRHSAYIGMIGTGFAFAAFPFSGWYGVNLFGYYEQALNTYFAMTASVIITYWSSAAFGGLKIGVRESLVGILSGGIIISAVSGYVNNIGACIAVGSFAGLISGWWLRRIHPSINQNHCYDHLGLVGPILINAVLGATFVAPILMAAYKSLGITVNQLNKAANQRASTYYLMIFAVAISAGIGFGAIAGFISLASRNPQADFQYVKLVSNDFGLYNSGNNNPHNINSPDKLNSLEQLNRDKAF